MARKSLLDRIALFGRSGLDVVQALGRSLIFFMSCADWPRWRGYWAAFVS